MQVDDYGCAVKVSQASAESLVALEGRKL